MPPLRSCWLALLLTRQEVYSLRRLVGPASLVDWRCSCSCSRLIPSVTEKSVIFVKELSFPQTAPTDDAFFNRTGQERVGVVWPEPGMLWTGLKALDRRVGPGLLLGWSAGSICGSSFHKRTRKKKGSAGASPVAAPMPKSVSF